MGRFTAFFALLALLSAGCAAPSSSSGVTVPEAASSAPPEQSFAASAPLPAMTREERTLLPGTPLETTLTILTGEEQGPTIFVVGGVHGDEVAGWTAAAQLLDEAALTAGRLCVITPANRPGAEANTRYVTGHLDLNRAFPGDPDGDEAQRLAAALYAEIKAAQPALLLDLHEAHIKQDNRDFLGSSVIFSSLDGMEDFVLSLLLATREGTVCSEPFGYFGPGPSGSINRAVTEGLSIPTLTVETYRDYPLERRVSDHLDILHYALSYYRLEG